MRPPRLYAGRALTLTVVGAVLIGVGFLFDAAPLFVPAVAFCALGILAPVWVWVSARGSRVHRSLADDRVVEEQPLEATVEVQRGPLGLPGAQVYDPFCESHLDLSGPLSAMEGDRVARVRVVASFSRRGLLSLGPPALHVHDPFELARVRAVAAAGPQQLLVLPRTEPVRWRVSEGWRRLELPDGDRAAETMALVEVDGLRPYRPGTPASRIHWPAVARGHGLLERRLRAEGDSRPLIVLDSRGAVPLEMLDAAVRAAASLALELGRHGGCGLLLPGQQRPVRIDRELTSWPAAHARLALVAGGTAARAPALGAYRGRLGPVFYVAPRPPERLSSLLGAGRGLLVLVIPHAALTEGRPPGVRGPLLTTLDVSGCRGFALGIRRQAWRDRGHEPEAAPSTGTPS